ncbi:hypothetical protein [Aeromonas sp. 1HA1]|uniref:hypothetical protein n=1 Tax=Aeromonas sp. 1HA1 TaxID=2699193 RepID=UPI0023DDB5C9|nr:hypothetical protein [Aeromonas sp. 1HA1]MDF2415826.1 hypothetical protein [Aeromonas sp. 1HA1]
MSKLVPYYVVRGLIATSWSALLAHRPWDLAIFHQGALKLSRRVATWYSIMCEQNDVTSSK